MKKEKKPETKLGFGFLDKIFPLLDEISKLQGTKTIRKTIQGKDVIFSSTTNIRPLKELQTSKKKEIKPEAEEREPLIDLFDEGKNLKIIAELPGIAKEDIKLKSKNNNLIISTKDKKYYKKLELHSKVRLKKFSYKNGVLEVILEKR